MDINTILYTAGFFDGEGYVGFGFRGRKEIRIANTNIEVLEFLKSKWGGRIYARKITPPRHKPAWDWVLLEKEKVKFFLETTRPYLIVKKSHVDRTLC